MMLLVLAAAAATAATDPAACKVTVGHDASCVEYDLCP